MASTLAQLAVVVTEFVVRRMQRNRTLKSPSISSTALFCASVGEDSDTVEELALDEPPKILARRSSLVAACPFGAGVSADGVSSPNRSAWS